MEAAGDTGVPMSFGVLTTNSAEEAIARAGAGPSNKGWEAGVAALEMARLYRGAAEIGGRGGA
jgi:6,7-dimethyl-8-ribityllumazine synthase